MNQRERVLAIVLLGVIFVGGGSLAAYLFYYRSLNSANLRQQKFEKDVAANNNKLKDLEASMPRLQQMKKLSLPADVNLAQREYGAEIGKLLRNANFEGEKFTITAKPIEKRELVPINKRLPYTRLYFVIQATGELTNIVQFLDSFYRLPLLHRIQSISIVRQATGALTGRPTGGDRRQPGRGAPTDERKNELVFNATVEALVIDGAEKRTTLLPKDVKPLERLARTKEQYVSIAGRNIFYGPPPSAATDGKDKKPRSQVDVTEYVVLDEITHDPDRGVQASLYDAYNNHKYAIKQLNDGSFLVNTYYYLKDVKKRLNIGEELEIVGDTGETQIVFKIARIDATDLVFQEKATGKYYRLHIGLPIQQAKALSASEAKAIGLQVAVNKDDAAGNGGNGAKKAPPPKNKVDDDGK